MHRLLFRRIERIDFFANFVGLCLSVLLLLLLSVDKSGADSETQSWLAQYQYQVTEACHKQADMGNCWALSILKAIGQHPDLEQSLIRVLQDSPESDESETALQQAFFGQHPEGVDAHSLNQLLAAALGIHILVIEEHQEGVSVHLVSEENGQPVVQLVASSESIETIDHGLLYSFLNEADIALLFTPEHVQPITSALPQPASIHTESTADNSRIPMAVPSSPVILVDFVSGSAGNLYGFKPPVKEALYGTTEGERNKKADNLFKERAKQHHSKWQNQKSPCKDWSCWLLQKSIVAVPVMAVGASYVYPQQAWSLLNQVTDHPAYQSYVQPVLHTTYAHLLTAKDKAAEAWKAAEPHIHSFAASSWESTKEWVKSSWTGRLSSGCDSEGKLVVYADDYDQYYTTGNINGHNIPMLIDSGASTVSISDVTAKKIGLEAYRAMGHKGICTTASTDVTCYFFEHTVTVGCFSFRVKLSVRETGHEDDVLLGTSFTKYLNTRIDRFSRAMTLTR